ncbi:hypothetical protein UFOVP317_48 [uncultured Caudovirales phage]|uniref:Uncharacterized protein n=1 Tax=uncultured Caudovirales phage TaxID=2100421 RepID=A0A6J5LSL5_9CAUD|nr:hypothetical protein UFOVP317_48 [uncultured Caudovirales phage]
MIILDCEVYRNYFLLAAMDVASGKVRHFEMYSGHDLDPGIGEMLTRHTSVGFNSARYDLPIIAAALRGMSCNELKQLSDTIIVQNIPHWQIGIKIPKGWDHIDLIELAIGQSSLKIYGGRLHAPKMQDLPIEPDANIAPDQRELLRRYCVNDLETTAILHRHLTPQIALREKMSEQYGVDLRSKSDAQIAEAVIRTEIERLGGDASKPSIKKNLTLRYNDPGFVQFESQQLRDVFARLLETSFTLGPNGSVEMPAWLKDQRIKIGQAEYQMGIGGLHSCEKRQFVEASKNEVLADFDVASFYPAIILGQRLAPSHLGEDFLTVFDTLVKRRLAAKRSNDKVTADVLKITINGTFGKLGSKYSFLYSPQLLIQTTITGQLAILMLIERMHLAGIRTVSANTDGIVLHADKALERRMEEVAWDWMLSTSYELERTDYRILASRDVNNYIAVKPDGSIKGKGVFAEPSLAKNPDCQIVYDAAANRIANGTPIERTIRECRDIRRFVTVRRVSGGAVWNGQPIGKAIRYYYSTSVPSDMTINYAKNGNKVAKSQGTLPLMELPSELPNDIDYPIYEVEAERLLCEVGYL